MLLRGQHRSFSMMTRRCRAGHRENDSGTKRNLSSDDDIVRHRPGIVRGRADLADQERIGGGEREGAPAFLADHGHEPAVFAARAQLVAARAAFAERRSEERRVGKEGGSTCKSLWGPYHE